MKNLTALGWAAACAFALPAAAVGAEASAPAASSIKVPLHSERTVETSDGSPLYVKVSGNGPVCMLVHGGPGQGSLSTEKMGFDALERFLTIIYVDQRGSGKSPDAENYHLERITQDFEDVRQALGIEKMCLIAHSFGGILAVDYARKYPERLTGMVLANATLQFLGPYNSRMQIEFANTLLGETIASVPDSDDPAQLEAALNQARAAVMKSGQGYRFLTSDIENIKRMGAIDASYPRSRGFGRAVFDPEQAYPEYFVDYAPLSRTIDMPVLVISSREDYAVGPDEYRRFAFPCQTTVILDGGHMSYHEQTVPFANAVEEFVRATLTEKGEPTSDARGCINSADKPTRPR